MELYSNFSKFVYRTPLNSYDSVIDLYNQTIDYQNIINDKLFEEAIYLTSTALYNSIFIEKKIEKSNLKSLYKYFIRFGSRCTPFGLFAGSGTGTIGNETAINFNAKSLRRSTRLDMDFLNEIAAQIKIYHKKLLSYKANTTGYQIDRQFRYIEYSLDGIQRKYQLNAISLNDLIEKLFSKIETEKTFDEIVNLIDLAISTNQKVKFVESLIENQIISSNIESAATGILFSKFLIETLQKLPKQKATNKLLSLLEKINNSLNELDSSFEGDKIATYSKIKEELEATNLTFNPNYLFQTDTYFEEKEQKISKQLASEAQIGLDILSRFSKEKNIDLENFKTVFSERYESRIIPLVEVLDDEIGIGFPAKAIIGESEASDLIKTINYLPKSSSNSVEIGTNDGFWIEKYEKALREKSQEIVLEKADWQNIPSKMDQLPPTISAMISLVKLDGKDSFLLKPMGCTTSLNLFGRFCLGNEQINALAFQIAQKEKEHFAGCIIAEIAHIPEKRVGNILMRPNFFDFEITYLSNSHLPLENQININDLMVGVENNEIVLYSKRLKKRVIPRLSNAHNYFENSLPFYNFLCSMQHQGLPALQLNLGNTFKQLTYSPRIRYKQIILKSASWKFTQNSTKNVKNYDDFKVFCNYWNLPKYVAITEGDNDLVADTQTELGYELIVDHFSKNSITILNEWLQFDENAQKTAHTNQIIIPFFKNIAEQISPIVYAESQAITRFFPPGTEWLYFKFYCGSNISEAWLSAIFTLLADFEQKKYIEKWFFIRYNDPHNHIRIRLKFTKMTEIGMVIEKIQNLFSSESLPKWKIQYDTYERELERYGHNSIEIIESLFHLDSKNYAQILNNKSQNLLNEDTRWVFCLYNVNFWLTEFFPDVRERLALIEKLRTSFMTEFQEDSTLKQNFSQIYRASRERIETIFIGNILEKDLKILQKQLLKNQKYFRKSKEILVENPNQNLSNLTSSFIHMNINRWHLTNQRLHEYFIYDMLFKLYRTIIAQST